MQERKIYEVFNFKGVMLKSKILGTRLVAMDAILMNPSISALTHITVQALATGRSVATVRT